MESFIPPGYAYEGARLSAVPSRASEQPSRDALTWHLESVFQTS